MTFDIDEMRSYLAIDKHALDEAVIHNPVLFDKVAEAYAEAAAERDALKEQLAVTDAQLDGTVRAKHAGATEVKIKALIQCHHQHQKAVTEWLEAKEYADKLGVLKEAFKDRSHMLRTLADLHVSGYFERTSIRPTHSTDEVVYRKRRERLQLAREKEND
jgi:uncharacterized protein YggL (DUF469 family)